jgi:predicted dehydrogenase
VIKSLAVDTSPTGRLAVGVVGGGLVAQVVHLPLLQRLDELFRVTALAEPDPSVRRAVAARHGIASTHAEHRSLLDAGGVDALLVCSPDATHAQVVVDALEAGVHVLVEKPLCVAPEEGEWIAGVRDRARRVVQVAYMKRYDPAVEALLSELPPGWAPTHIATATVDPGMRAAFGMAPADAPMRIEEAFLGALIHDVNLVNAVLARCGTGVARIVDAFGDGARAGATIELDNGARWTAVWLSLPGAGTFREQVTLYGADGVRELEFAAPYALHDPTVYRHLRAGGGGAVSTVRTSWAEAYERQLRHFHAAVTGAAECRTPAEEGLADVRLLTEMLAACGAGVAP